MSDLSKTRHLLTCYPPGRRQGFENDQLKNDAVKKKKVSVMDSFKDCCLPPSKTMVNQPKIEPYMPNKEEWKTEVSASASTLMDTCEEAKVKKEGWKMEVSSSASMLMDTCDEAKVKALKNIQKWANSCDLSIEELNARYNAFDKILESMRLKPDTWDLSDLGLTEIPPNLFGLGCVKINLSKNNIDTSSETFVDRLTDMEEVNLSDNKIVDLPCGFFTLSELAKLDLSKNCLESFSNMPTDTVVWKLLKELTLDENQFKEIPIAPKLEYTESENWNNMTYQRQHKSYYQKLEVLSLKKNKIEDMGNIRFFTKLGTLYLDDNQITDIKNGFTRPKRLEELKILSLSGNEIRFFNKNQFAFLEMLEDLSIEFSEDTDISDVIEGLRPSLRGGLRNIKDINIAIKNKEDKVNAWGLLLKKDLKNCFWSKLKKEGGDLSEVELLKLRTALDNHSLCKSTGKATVLKGKNENDSKKPNSIAVTLVSDSFSGEYPPLAMIAKGLISIPDRVPRVSFFGFSVDLSGS